MKFFAILFIFGVLFIENNDAREICNNQCIEAPYYRGDSICCVYDKNPQYGNAYCCVDLNNPNCICIAWWIVALTTISCLSEEIVFMNDDSISLSLRKSKFSFKSTGKDNQYCITTNMEIIKIKHEHNEKCPRERQMFY